MSCSVTCLRTNIVLLVAGTRQEAVQYARSELPATVEGRYVATPEHARGYCREHVAFAVVGSFTANSTRMHEWLLERGYQEVPMVRAEWNAPKPDTWAIKKEVEMDA